MSKKVECEHCKIDGEWQSKARWQQPIYIALVVLFSIFLIIVVLVIIRYVWVQKRLRKDLTGIVKYK